MNQEYISAEDLPIGALTVRQFKELLSGMMPAKQSKKAIDEDILLTVKEAAEMYKCSRSSLFSYLKQGLIKRTRVKGTGKLLFKKSDLLKLIDQDNNQNKK